MYVHESVTYTRCPDLESDAVEALVIRVTIPHAKPVFVAVVYRPPSAPVAWYGVFDDFIDRLCAQILQQDLHKLARWEVEYSMEFHPEKCNVLRVTRSRSPSIFNYTLHGTNLKSTESTKYLGVTLTKDLTWGKHIDIIRAKANQQLAFVRRNIRTQSSSTKEKLFNTLVRPHLEYAATVWDPHISKQKHSLEIVQRRAARWVTNRHHNTSSVTDMLHTLGWTSLEHRRATSRLCMLYQIYHGSIGIPHDPYILPYRHTPRPSRQTDMHTLSTYQCRTNYFKCSFFPQTIVAWQHE